jgi:hypothetical protein
MIMDSGRMRWSSLAPQPVRTEEDAVAFVEALGFCTWGPVPGIEFPNLAEQMGETAASVLARTWFWKDDAHFDRKLYYAKVIRGQPTFIAPEYLPDFVAALAGRGQEVEREPLRLFQEGRLSRQARIIFDYLVDHPALPTRELRRGTRLYEKVHATATENALAELQRRFLICKVGLTGRTRGTYSYVWDLADRFAPEAFEDAARTSVAAARARVRSRLTAFGLTPTPTMEQRLFLWRS